MRILGWIAIFGERHTVNGKPKHLNEALVRSLPDQGPVTMVNLVRFRRRSADGTGTGWDAYLRYSTATMPLIKARGGTVLWAGNAEGLAFGNGANNRWDYVVLVRYPSRSAFLDMMTSPEYATANIDRENAVDDHVIIAATETYSKFKSS
ncbi:MAG: DUF1330 domain-containing protein [Betaproteobacteria bacterium]|nr:MAG: DUF1330 domain-containing protein [Betaproteobacteria bacterium]